MSRLASFTALTLALQLSTAAWADQWKIDPEASTITFTVIQNGDPFEGRFERFTGEIDFTPGENPTGQVEIRVPVASIDTGADDRDQQAQGGSWFAAEEFPDAVFRADKFRRTGPDSYEADGMLSMRDAQVPLTLPFDLNVTGDRAVMDGGVTLDRSAYGVGQGQFEGDSMVGHDVEVDLHVEAERAG